MVRDDGGGVPVAFAGSVAMFRYRARNEPAIAHSEQSGLIARNACTYLYLPIVAGMVCAVADELILLHPTHADDAGIAAILGGPALYLLGNALFNG